MSSSPTTTIAIALGSNQGDRHGHLAYAVGRLADFFLDLHPSTIHETEPVGVSLPQPPFLNMAVVAQTTRPASDVLAVLLEIERARGRERPFAGAPRTLDLDLILHGDTVIDTPALTVPHPRFRDRWFVLTPLAEVGSDLRDPVTGLTITQLLQRLEVGGQRSGDGG